MLVSPRGRERSHPRFPDSVYLYHALYGYASNEHERHLCAGVRTQPRSDGCTAAWRRDKWLDVEQVRFHVYDYHCLIPDLPEHGHGCGIKPFTIEDRARQIADLIRYRVPGGRAHVVGHSLGGQGLVALLAMAPHVAPHVLDRAVVSSALLQPLPMAGLLSAVSRAVLPLARNPNFRDARHVHFTSPTRTSKPTTRTLLSFRRIL
jgi:pimeloyl-ACP methyl ester carboxylesterase